jgi:hypothetical protein
LEARWEASAPAFKRRLSLDKIAIGASSARGYLEQQVAPAYSRFLGAQSRENALSVAAVLWDTVGWLWSDLNPGIDRRKNKTAADNFDANLFKRCPDLAPVRDLADAAKHGGELGRSSVVVKGISGSGSPGGTTFAFSPLGMLQSTPECTLQIDLKDGSRRDLKQALAAVYEFLRAETSHQ